MKGAQVSSSQYTSVNQFETHCSEARHSGENTVKHRGKSKVGKKQSGEKHSGEKPSGLKQSGKKHIGEKPSGWSTVEKSTVEKSKVEKSKVECSDKPVSPSQYNSVNQFEATRKCTQANQLPPTARLYIKLYLHLCLVMHIQ